MGWGVPSDVHLNFVYVTIYQMIALLARPAVKWCDWYSEERLTPFKVLRFKC